jgi:hypothetical protein
LIGSDHANHDRIWLYTTTAKRIHARAGWQTIEAIQIDRRPFPITRRDFVDRR